MQPTIPNNIESEPSRIKICFHLTGLAYRIATIHLPNGLLSREAHTW